MMARSQTAPFKGRIQKRKTKRLHSSHLACNTRPVHTVGSSTCRQRTSDPGLDVNEIYPMWVAAHGIVIAANPCPSTADVA